MDYQFLTPKQRLAKLKGWLTAKENQHYEATTNLLNTEAAGADGEQFREQIASIEKLYARMLAEYEILSDEVERAEQEAPAEAPVEKKRGMS